MCNAATPNCGVHRRSTPFFLNAMVTLRHWSEFENIARYIRVAAEEDALSLDQFCRNSNGGA